MIINSLAPLKDVRFIACVSLKKYKSKYSAAFNLGQSLSVNCNAKVLCVDLSERKSSDTKWTKSGLYDLYKGNIQSIHQSATCISNNLYSISPGNSIKELTLLSSQQTTEVFSELRSHFEYVCVELPDAKHFPALYRIVPIFEGIIIVIECEHTKWEIGQRFKNILTDSGGNILGTILCNRKFYLPKWLYSQL